MSLALTITDFESYSKAMARKHSSLQTLVDNHCMMEPIHHIQDTESIKLQFEKQLLDCRPA
jgi:hypothetical protein